MCDFQRQRQSIMVGRRLSPRLAIRDLNYNGIPFTTAGAALRSSCRSAGPCDRHQPVIKATALGAIKGLRDCLRSASRPFARV